MNRPEKLRGERDWIDNLIPLDDDTNEYEPRDLLTVVTVTVCAIVLVLSSLAMWMGWL